MKKVYVLFLSLLLVCFSFGQTPVTYTTTTTWRDPGGTSNYGDGLTYNYTFQAQSNKFWKINFTEFYTEANYDYLYLNTNSSFTGGTAFTGSSLPSGNPYYSSIGGAFYSKFTSDAYENESGWLASANLIDAGDGTSYGSGSWIGYAYTWSGTPAFTTKIGYVTATERFDRDYDANPFSASDVNICPPYPSDYFAVRYKMTKSFTAGYYTFNVGADDGVRLSVDGGATWLIDQWHDQAYTEYTATAYLSGSKNLVLEYYENAGGARISFTYAAGDMATSGSGSWLGYLYEDYSGTFPQTKYRGYVTESELINRNWAAGNFSGATNNFYGTYSDNYSARYNY